jgi:hypothetical protein
MRLLMLLLLVGYCVCAFSVPWFPRAGAVARWGLAAVCSFDLYGMVEIWLGREAMDVFFFIWFPLSTPFLARLMPPPWPWE